MRIAMVGAGYVGLVSAACFADLGHHVVCADADQDKVRRLQNEEIPISEPGLKELVGSNVAAKRLEFTAALDRAVEGAEVVFLAVGTPERRASGAADLAYLRQAVHDVARLLSGFTVIATKSTVPVGTGDEIEHTLATLNPGAEVAVVSNPEFLREGSAIDDFKRPDRIVIGTDDVRARRVMSAVYLPLLANPTPIMFTSRRTAELAKYAANSFLAMKVAFINEMADLCEAVNADVEDVARAMGMDKRIGAEFLRAGPGFGGSCLPKDARSLVCTAQTFNSPLRLVEATVALNDERRRSIARKVIAACGGSVHGKKIAVLGLTFKPGTDDMRNAPSLPIIQALQDCGAHVTVYDPVGMDAARKIIRDVSFGVDAYDAAAGASALVVVTEWDTFTALDFNRLKELMAEPVVVDLRNIYNPEDMRRSGFRYGGVGRASGARDAAADADR
jgi:UDPglucose 6-dehydrogenase